MADMGRSATREVSPWATGYAIFAATMMIMLGVFHAIQGLVALFNDEFYVRLADYTFKFDVTTWGWIHLLLGILVALAGFALLSGQVWARAIGMLLAGLSAIASFAWLPYYPVWSIVVIALAIAVIWGLANYRVEDL